MSITSKYAQVLADEQGGWFCIYCGSTVQAYRPGDPPRGHGKAEVDHIVPKSRGGLDDLSNLALACVSCNAAKNNMTAHEFVLWRREYLDKQARIEAIRNE